MTQAFTDTNGGYYQTEEVGVPLWAINMIPCSVIIPPPPVIPPDPAGFEQAVKTALGGIIGSNALMVAYPAFMPALQQGDYVDLQVLILDAQTKGLLTAAQYASIQAANTQFNLGMTLP